MTTQPHKLQTGRDQSGAALIIGLIFLVILTLLGVSAMQATSLEERMSGNARSRNVALQAAEAALKDAEVYILSKLPANYTAACTSGLCNAAGILDWKTYAWDKTKSVEYGTNPSPAAATSTKLPDESHGGVKQQAQYYIELGSVNTIRDATGSNVSAQFYTIIARGWGGDTNTKVTLREVYIVY